MSVRRPSFSISRLFPLKLPTKPIKRMSNAGYYVLGGIGAYILTSIFFLRCPVLYKKKRLNFKCSHISHRGGCCEKLENTRHAYRHAVQYGTQMLELDVQLTADKIVVISHDDNLKRVTGEDVCIKDLRYEELPLLQNEISVTFDPTKTCCHEGEQLGIEKLEDVFQEFPTIPIHLDVKTYNEELMEKTRELIKKYNREDITPWGNFSDKVTSKLYKIDPNIPLVFSMRRVITTLVTFYLGLLPFLPIKESAFSIMMPGALKKSFKGSSFDTRTFRALLSVVDFLLMSRILFKHLTDRGINVYLWVVNEDEDFKRAFKLGATGVMTDCPSELQRWLDENAKYKSDF